jgi:hypothetical protein
MKTIYIGWETDKRTKLSQLGQGCASKLSVLVCIPWRLS